jgi:UPF0755 protein
VTTDSPDPIGAAPAGAPSDPDNDQTAGAIIPPPAPAPAPESESPPVAGDPQGAAGAPELPPMPRRSEPIPPPEPLEGPLPDPRLARRRAARRVGLSLLAVVVALLVLAGVGSWWVLVRPTGPDVPAGRQVKVTIPAGADVVAISRKLDAAGIIGNANGFQLSVRFAGTGDQLKSGTYELTTGMPDDAVIDALSIGPQSEAVMVTIPEGYTVRQIAKRLETKVGMPADQFMDLALHHAADFKAAHPYLRTNTSESLEGYLFPKTYALRRGAKPAEVIDLMLEQFGKEIDTIDMTYARSKNLNIHDVVTIASIVEKEALVARERPLVSSVVYNRLKARMRLGMESTVRYALDGRAGTLTYQDVRVDHPYNTYIHKGLPPGPICNPGIAALEAAARPVETKYLYFVTTGKDGSSTFTTNASDFEKAKARGVH